MYRIYDAEPKPFTLEMVKSFVHPDDRDWIGKYLVRGLTEGYEEVVDYRIVSGLGVTKFVRSHTEVIRDSKGDIVKLFGTLQDITERKRIETELLNSRGLLSFGEQVASSGSFELNLKTRKTRWSDNLYRITGFDLSTEITFESFIKHVHPDDQVIYRQTLRESLSSNQGHPFVYRFIRPDNGEIIYLQANGRPLENNGKVTSWIGSIQDITDRILTQLELERSQASLIEAQKIARVGNWEWDAGTEEVWWSDEMYNIYEIDKRPITLSDVKSFIHPEDRKRVEELTKHDLDDKIVPVIEYRIYLPSGRTKYVISSAKQVYDSKGKVTRLIGTLQDVTEKVEAEFQSKADQIQRELTLQASQIGVWHWLINENRLDWDDRCFEIYDIEKRDLNPQDFIEFMVPEDRELIQARIADAFSSGEYRSEYRINTKNGIKYLHGRGKVTFGDDNVPVRMDGIIIDMTARHDIEQALRESEQLFRDMAESITEVFWLTDWDLNDVLYVSPQYEKLYGLSVESLYEDSTSWSKAIHPEDLERATSQFKKHAMSGDYDEVYRLLLEDGTVKWVRDRAFPVFNADGSVSRVAGITEDITKQRLDQERIETLSLVASETINGVLIHEPDGTVVWANKGFERITGYSADEIIGKEPWSEVADPKTDQRLVQMTYEKIQAGKSFSSDNILRHKDGSSVWVNVSFTPILDDFGNITKVVSIGMDISKQKETEQLQRDMLLKLEKANEELKKRAGD